MNIDFSYCNPTQIHFGRTAMKHLPSELSKYGRNVLLVYGKSSIKRIGLYDQVMEILKAAGKCVTEFSGINSNPRYSQVMEGARLVRENDVDLILAVGGGSVIDCCKGISACAYATGDPWQRFWMTREAPTEKVVPVGTILTMVGTGSEMNSGSVITNEELKQKNSAKFPLDKMCPRFSIMNPEFTYSVPEYQMVSGIFDIFSHLLEQYLSGDDDCATDYLIEGDMLALISAARKAKTNPKDYEARSNIMWCATMALNRILGVSKTQDWEVHMIEHQLGAYTDCAHGIGLAIITPAYFRHVYKYGLHRYVRFAKNVWKVEGTGMSDEEIALEGFARMESFIRELGIPSTLREVGATRDMLPLIANSAVLGGGYYTVTPQDILEILEGCF